MRLPSFLAALALQFAALGAEAHVFNGYGYPGYNFVETPTAAGVGSLGFAFTVTRLLPVGGLGYWDEGGDGLLADHPVGLFLDDGPGGLHPLLASAVVPAGKASYLDTFFGSRMPPSGFRYVQIPTVALYPGQTYILAGFSPDLRDPWVYGGPSETLGFDLHQYLYGGPADVTIGPDAGRFDPSPGGLVAPQLHVGDIQFYAVNFVVTPEPATWMSMLLGFGLLGAALRRRRAAITL